MSIERFDDKESMPGEFEFQLVFSALKAKFAGAKDEQQFGRYRMFAADRIKASKHPLARFKLIPPELLYDFQVALSNPETVIDVGLPVVFPDTDNPMLISDSPFATEQPDYFVLFKDDAPVIIDAQNIQTRVLDADPGFVGRAVVAEVAPLGRPHEEEI